MVILFSRAEDAELGQLLAGSNLIRSSIWFAGEAVYARERERIMGQRAKRTERLAAAAARRSRSLAFAYSVSLATAYAIIAADTLNRVTP